MSQPPSLELNVKTMWHHTRLPLGFGDALEVAYDHVRSSLRKTASRRKRLYDTKAVNRKFPVGLWVLRYYPPAAQHKLGSPWIGPHQVVRQATGHTVGIQHGADKPIIFVHVDDLKLCPGPQEITWTPKVSTAKSLCASTVAFRPGSDLIRSFGRPPVIQLAFSMAQINQLFLFTSTILNYAQDHRRLHGPRKSPLLNICVPARWLFVRDQQ